MQKHRRYVKVLEELELELIRTQMAQKPMLRVEVGARALRNPVGRYVKVLEEITD